MNQSLIIDCNAICHAAKHTLDGLYFEDQKVGVIFGFLNRLIGFNKQFNPENILFVWDSGENYRKKIFPEYKLKRKSNKTEEEKRLDSVAFSQFDELREHILPFIGFRNIFYQVGFEADDIMAQIVKDYCRRNFVIVTTDSDIYQLLGETVKIYNPKKKEVMTELSFRNEYGIAPKDWIRVKAIAGCTSDEIPGIEHVGEKTAIKYIKNDLKTGSVAFDSITYGHEIIERNLKLVTLPLEGTESVKIKRDFRNIDNFVSVCESRGFMSMLKKETYKRWEAFLERV
jgi:DNA polymerase I